MRNKAALSGLVLIPALLLTACGAGDSEDRALSGTAGVLVKMTGNISVDEAIAAESVEEQTDASDVVITGPVTNITDLGPVGPGTVTHTYALTVRVEETIQGDVGGQTAEVTVLGMGSAADLRKGLSNDRGLWMLKRVDNQLVPVVTAAVLFEVDGRVVAPFAEMGHGQAKEKTLAEAIEKARSSAGKRS